MNALEERTVNGVIQYKENETMLLKAFVAYCHLYNLIPQEEDLDTIMNLMNKIITQTHTS